jgi:hypothetical protein
MTATGQFLRRNYSDGRQHSICLTCFLIAAMGTEGEVTRGETQNDCEKAIQLDCLRPLLQHAG